MRKRDPRWGKLFLAAYVLLSTAAVSAGVGAITARSHATFEDRFGMWVESEFWRKRTHEIFQHDRWRHYSPMLPSRVA